MPSSAQIFKRYHEGAQRHIGYAGLPQVLLDLLLLCIMAWFWIEIPTRPSPSCEQLTNSFRSGPGQRVPGAGASGSRAGDVHQEVCKLIKRFGLLAVEA